MKNEIVTICLDAVMTTELPPYQVKKNAELSKKQLKQKIEERLEEVLAEVYAEMGFCAVDPNFAVVVSFFEHDDHGKEVA